MVKIIYSHNNPNHSNPSIYGYGRFSLPVSFNQRFSAHSGPYRHINKQLGAPPLV